MEQEVTEKEAAKFHVDHCVALMKAERLKQKIALSDVANRIGMDLSQLSRCESGERSFRLVEFTWYCGVMGYSLVPMKNKQGE